MSRFDAHTRRLAARNNVRRTAKFVRDVLPIVYRAAQDGMRKVSITSKARRGRQRGVGAAAASTGVPQQVAGEGESGYDVEAVEPAPARAVHPRGGRPVRADFFEASERLFTTNSERIFLSLECTT